MTIRQAIFATLIAAVMVATPLQFIIDPSAENAACTTLVMAASLVVLVYLYSSSALQTTPLQAFALFGLCVTMLLGALLVQTVAWTPLRSSLYDPLGTFGTLTFFEAIALAMLVTYRHFLRVSRGVEISGGFLRRTLYSLNIYEVPPVATLWFMGIVGFVVGFVLSVVPGTFGRVAAGGNFLAWAPFLIPLYRLQMGDSYCRARTHYLMLVGYTMCFGVLGLAVNARGIMFSGLVTVFLLYLLTGMRSNEPVTGKIISRCAMAAIVALVLAVPLSNLTTSMAIARQWRGHVTTVEMIRTTLRVWSDPKLIAAYKLEHDTDVSHLLAYDEHYIANPMLARFVNTKFVDNSLHFAAGIRTEDARARLREMTIKFLWAGLPAPVLHVLHINVDKDELGFSIGDYLAYLARGVRLGGHKVGSMFAQGNATLGPVFPFVYGGICLVFFAITELLTVRRADGTNAIATLGMLEIWQFFSSGLHYEAFHYMTLFVVRNFAQTVVIYAVVFAVARVVTRTKPPVVASHAWA